MAQVPSNPTLRSNPSGSNEIADDDDFRTDVEEGGSLNANRADRAADSSRTRLEKPRRQDNAFGTSYLGDGKTEESWQQWRQIQANFVDDPRSSVAEAHGLVGNLIDGIVRRFESERQQLEQRWSSGEDVSTEELRRCLQGYRDFFGRMLANLGDTKQS
jgi:hypothetical protein